MNRHHHARWPEADAGISLIEVVVAMLVFAIIASGLVAGMVSITRMTGDNRAKVVAANLAAQDLDLVRAIADPFKITSKPATDVLVGGRTYSVVRTVSWVSQRGVDVSCSSSTNLYLLRVNVRVTWQGQFSARSVQDDTIVAPSGRTSDSTTGAIAVSIVGVDGLPESGVTVNITAVAGGGGATPTSQPAATGADGCSYSTKLAPGEYTVKISRSGWIEDQTRVPTPTRTRAVAAGTTESANFVFDQAATYLTAYAKNYAVSSALLPSGLQTNFISTNPTMTTTTPAANVLLPPYASGYSVVLGIVPASAPYCASVDPQAWLSGTSNGVGLGNGIRASGAALGGKTTTFGTPANPTTIPMGVVSAKPAKNATVKAVQSTTLGAGDPGCGVTSTTYTWSTKGTGNTMALALPFGSWKLYANSALIATGLSIPTNAAGGGVAGDGTVTLDPRPVS